jgi:hypothetical protein
VFEPRVNLAFTATDGELDEVAREREIHERMKAHADAGDYCGALQTFLDAPPGSYDVSQFQVLLSHAFGNGYHKLRNQSKAEERSVRRKHVNSLRKGLTDLAARFEAALREAKSLMRHSEKINQLVEKLRQVERTERIFREWSRTLLLAQRAEKSLRQTAEMKLQMPLSPARREVWEAAIKLCDTQLPWPYMPANAAELRAVRG